MKSFEKNFDGDLEMFRENPPVSFEKLRFVRWLVENGKLEHPAAGPPSGPFAEEPIELPVILAEAA